MAGLPRAIMDPEEYRSRHPNFLFYGESGVGKTPWLMQLPKLLVLATDSEGTISAKTWGKGTKVWPIRRWPDFVEAMDFLESGQTTFDKVLIDTIGTLQTRLVRYILEVAHAQNPVKYDLDVPQIQDHQRWQNMLKRVVMDLNDMPISVIWTAQEMLREDAEGEEMTLPLLPGGKNQYEIAMWVTSVMHVVGRIGAKTVELKGGSKRVDRGVIFEKRPPYVARDRTGTLPPSLRIAAGSRIETTAVEIMDMIKAGGAAALERAEKMVESRADTEDDLVDDSGAEDDTPAGMFDPNDPEGTGPGIVVADVPGKTTNAYGLSVDDDKADAPPTKSAAKKAPAKNTTGRKFRAADSD